MTKKPNQKDAVREAPRARGVSLKSVASQVLTTPMLEWKPSGPTMEEYRAQQESKRMEEYWARQEPKRKA